MKMNLLTLMVTVVFIMLVFPVTSQAVTMSEEEINCPLCDTVNQFYVLTSWGSYVYVRYPISTVNWPVTKSFPLYMCKACKYAAFSWDFDELPAGKYREAREVLKTVEIKGTADEYSKIPMSVRLEAAEKVYRLWKTDDDFWSEYYRIMGHHYENEGKTREALAARMKALALLEKMLDEVSYKEIRKELTLYSGAMKHLLNDDKQALADFEKALGMTFHSTELDQEKNKEIDEYFTGYLKFYINYIKEGPQEAGTEGDE